MPPRPRDNARRPIQSAPEFSAPPTATGGPRPDAKPDRRPSIGARFRLTVETLTLGGEAICKADGYVLFTPGVLPGEQVTVEVVSTGRKYGRAKLVSVDQPSPSRVQAPCPHFGVCGGCAWQHIDYPEQLRIKEQLLRNALEHKSTVRPLPMAPILGMETIWGTRNKAHFVLAANEDQAPAHQRHLSQDAAASGPGVHLAHYRAHSKQTIPIVECPVQHPEGNRLAQRAVHEINQLGLPAFEERSRKGLVRHLVCRVNSPGTEAQLTVVATRARHPGAEDLAKNLRDAEPSLKSVSWNQNVDDGVMVMGQSTVKLAGEARITETIGGIAYQVSAVSFFQTNAAAAKRLVETVLRFLPDHLPGPILDLYAGVGLFALPLAKKGFHVLAIEENPLAVGDGVASAKANRIPNVRFLAGRIETVLRQRLTDGPVSAVILDPPRIGCSPTALRLVAQQYRPQWIIDVSCDPASLAKDLTALQANGYTVREIQPIDMFPHTPHIETVALFERNEPALRESPTSARPTTPPRRPNPRSRRPRGPST